MQVLRDVMSELRLFLDEKQNFDMTLLNQIKAENGEFSAFINKFIECFI